MHACMPVCAFRHHNNNHSRLTTSACVPPLVSCILPHIKRDCLTPWVWRVTQHQCAFNTSFQSTARWHCQCGRTLTTQTYHSLDGPPTKPPTKPQQMAAMHPMKWATCLNCALQWSMKICETWAGPSQHALARQNPTISPFLFDTGCVNPTANMRKLARCTIYGWQRCTSIRTLKKQGPSKHSIGPSNAQHPACCHPCNGSTTPSTSHY